MPGGEVAYGNYNPDNRKVWFNRNDPSCEGANYGFREEISRKTKELRSSFLRDEVDPTVCHF